MEGQEVDWDFLSKIGHSFTLTGGPLPGREYIYYCEHCSALMIVSGSGLGQVEVWHHPGRIDYSCSPISDRPVESLESKIKRMGQRRLA